MREFILVILIIGLFSTAFAYEVPLKDFGFLTLENKTSATKECKDVTISLPQSALEEKGVGIISLQGIFEGDLKDTTYISYSINNGAEKILWYESFTCKNNCWARIFVPELKKEETKLTICAVLGGVSKLVAITGSSLAGVYDSPLIEIYNEAPVVVQLGERVKMSTIVSNKGDSRVSIFVQFIHPDTRAKVPIASFDIIEGQSSAQTVLAPGETKQFDYYIKPNLVSLYNLPSAALFFTNYFGEEQVITSSHLTMSVINPKHLEISLVSLEEQNGKMFKAIVKNNQDTQFNGTIILSPQAKIINSTREISVGPKSEKEITFEATNLEEKNYSFFATIRDANQIYSSNQITIEVTKQGLPMPVILTILGIIIGAVIFAWISFTREK